MSLLQPPLFFWEVVSWAVMIALIVGGIITAILMEHIAWPCNLPIVRGYVPQKRHVDRLGWFYLAVLLGVLLWYGFRHDVIIKFWNLLFGVALGVGLIYMGKSFLLDHPTWYGLTSDQKKE